MPVGFSFSLLDMARNRLSLGGVRLTRPIFIAFQVSGSRTFGIGLAALSFVLSNLLPPVSEILKLAGVWPARGSVRFQTQPRNLVKVAPISTQETFIVSESGSGDP
jgi:hypothetical protein